MSGGKCRLSVNGLDCPTCAEKIRRRVEKLPNIDSADIDVTSGIMRLEYSGVEDFDALVGRISKLAGKIEPGVTISHQGETVKPAERPEWMFRLVRAVGAAVLLLTGMLLPNYEYVSVGLCIAAYLLAGTDVLILMVRNLFKGQIFDENFLMAIATLGALYIGERPEAAAIMIFYQLGQTVENVAVGRSRRSIAALANIRPDRAGLLRPDGTVEYVSPDSVPVGSLVEIRAGEKIPLDGIVQEGQSSVDTAALTGEPMPRDVRSGDEVLAGCVNRDGRLVIRTEREYGASVAARIIDMMQNAAAKKARTEKFITRFARVYTPAVVAAAVLIALIPPLVTGGGFQTYFERALVFLVISCPCALVISVPLGYFGGLGGASRAGVLVKGGAVLEALARTDTVVLDKTGTLTQGKFSGSAINPAPGVDEMLLIAKAAAAESVSNHPIAQSIAEYYGKNTQIPEDYAEMPGLGISAQISGRTVLAGNPKLMEKFGVKYDKSAFGTTVHLAEDSKYLGFITISDTLRPDAEAAVAGLRELGVKRILVLTGDTPESAQTALGKLGLDDIRAGLLPDGKLAELEAIMEDSAGSVVFVGDGINDAPVLARSDVGFAMGGIGSDAAVEASDAVIMADSPEKLCDAIAISRKTRSIIVQNVILALGIKAIIMGLGACGLASMWAAAFADVGVALLCILNAFRAMRTVKTEGGGGHVRA